MRVSTALARASSSSGAVSDWFPDMQFHYKFTNKSADSDLNGNVSDSGHTMVSNYGADIEAVGKILASPTDSLMVYSNTDTGSDSSANHLLTPGLGNRIVYLRAKFRIPTGSTNSQSFAVLPWENWAAQDSTTTSPAHILCTRSGITAQIYTNLAATTQWTHNYASAFADNATQEIEIAIDPTAKAVVIRCPDGFVDSYATVHAGLTNYSIADFELYLPNPNTDGHPEALEIGATTAASMTAEIAQAHDDLLVLEGYGSAWVPPGYSDDFNRADSATGAGTNWTNRNGILGITGNTAYGVTTGSYNIASYNTALAGDDFEVTVTLGAVSSGSGSHVTVVGGANTTGVSAIGFWQASGTCTIYTMTNWAMAGLTARGTSSGSVTLASGDTLTLRRVGNVYTGLRNGSAIAGMTWTDSGNVLARDSTQRIAGCGSHNSAGAYRRIDSWSAV